MSAIFFFTVLLVFSCSYILFTTANNDNNTNQTNESTIIAPIRISSKYLGYKSLVPLTCNDIYVTNIPLWGFSSSGLYLTQYTYPLQFIGCCGDGCSTTSFYCRAVNDTAIEFGATSNALRALFGNYQSNAEWPTSRSGCCSASSPNSICNSPMDDLSANQLCIQLGYDKGTVNRGSSNVCPKVFWNGNTWTSDFQQIDGYGQYYQCSYSEQPPEKCLITYRSTGGNNEEYTLDLTTISNDTIIHSINQDPSSQIRYVPCFNNLQCINGGGSPTMVQALVYSNIYGCVTSLITPDSRLNTYYNTALKRWQLTYVTLDQCEGEAVFEIFWNCQPNIPTYAARAANYLGGCNWNMTIDSALACSN